MNIQDRITIEANFKTSKSNFNFTKKDILGGKPLDNKVVLKI